MTVQTIPEVPAPTLAEWSEFCEFLERQPRKSCKPRLVPQRFVWLVSERFRKQRTQYGLVRYNTWGWRALADWRPKLNALIAAEGRAKEQGGE